MTQRSGELHKLGRTKELLGTIERYGDRAMNFIWRNKSALAVGIALVTFLNDPEPYINGAKKLGEAAMELSTQPAERPIGAPDAATDAGR